MPLDDARDADQRPLMGPNGRFPSIQAVTLTRPSALTTLRTGWLPRHTAAMAVLSPLVFLMYGSALGRGFDSAPWNVLVGAMALVAALILTTYLPAPGARRAAASSCAVMAGLLVPAAALLLNQVAGIAGGVLALGILILGVWQRLSGTSTCG